MKRRIAPGAFAAAGIFVLIFDAKTAIAASVQAVELCLRTVIPSMLPFMVLSMVLTGALSGVRLKLFRPVARLCGIPEGAEGMLIVGFLGGYPVGAQAVGEAYRENRLTKSQAQRLLRFCSNAGPAFIFGIVAAGFSQWWAPWLLWLIHIVSALAVGILQPKEEYSAASLPPAQPVSFQSALSRGITVMARICGWILLFRILIAVLHRWLGFLLPNSWQVLLRGFLELTNGCTSLPQITNDALRFVIAGAMLSFGGVCVAMQTGAVIGKLSLVPYFQGKLLQTLITVSLCMPAQLLFSRETGLTFSAEAVAGYSAVLGIFGIILWEMKKRSSISQAMRV